MRLRRLLPVSAAALALASALPAQAEIITVTYEGLLASGSQDSFGYFGLGSNLTGRTATFVFTFDTQTPGADLMGTGNHQHIRGLGPDRGGACCSPGSAAVTIGGTQLFIDGDDESFHMVTYYPGPDFDQIGTMAQDSHDTLTGSGEKEYHIWRFAYAAVGAPLLLTSGDLGASQDFSSAYPDAVTYGGLEYEVYDYARQRYDHRVSLTFDYGNMTYSSRSSGNPPVPPSAIPEPASWAMMIGGFALAGGGLRRMGQSVRFA